MTLPQEGARVGAYELVARIGQGGMAETWIATRRGPGDFEQRVCLKRIRPEHRENELFLKLFLREARIAAQIRHANVVQVIDFGEVDGTHFLALELIDGADLYSICQTLHARGERMPHDVAVHIACETAAALDAAHRLDAAGLVTGVVHRDVSPSNILISAAGEVKLTDFGIAKPLGPSEATRSEVLKGKVSYMAPEYALTGQCDQRGDLFALGVTLYECVVGTRPFWGRTDLETLAHILDGAHTPVHDVASEAPIELAAVIERLLARDPSARFARASDIIEALAPIAPPPTIRRTLADLVRSARAGADAKRRRETLVVDPNSRPVLKDRTAPADAQTATRGPAASLRLDAVPTPLTEPPLGAVADPLADPLAEPRGPWSRAKWLGPIALIVAVGAIVGAIRAVRAGMGNPSSPPAEPPAARAPIAPTGWIPLEARVHSPGPNELPIGADTPAGPVGGGAPGIRTPAPSDLQDPSAGIGARASLTVTVVPAGDVWIDGGRAGRSPLTVVLAAGQHTVGTGNGGQRNRTTVVLEAGERRDITLR